MTLQITWILDADYPSSNSVKIDGQTDVQNQADCSSKIKTVAFSN